MTFPLYLADAYQKESGAVVRQVQNGAHIILNQTLFYAVGGGQPHDEGAISHQGKIYKVKMVKKTSEGIFHEVDQSGLKPNDRVHLKLDWRRRYTLMRYHTAAHLLSAVFHREAGAEITGNQMEIDKGRIDFSLDIFSKEQVDAFITKANQYITQDAPVKVYTLAKEQALQDPSLFKLALSK
jgi:misacylated tRNA(Ala) deacylase